jgi:hypothetical protein
MTDKFNTLLEIAEAADQSELKIAHNARIMAMQAYNQAPTKATAENMAAAKTVYAEVVEFFWAKYHPESVVKDHGELFRDKEEAHRHYQRQGGVLGYRAFANKVNPVKGRKIARSAVTELLLAEAIRQSPAQQTDRVDLAARRDDADTRKAEADAEKAEMQTEEMRRQQDKFWLQRDRAEEITCVWVSRLRDAVAYHLDKTLLAIIHGCGGKPERQSEVKAIIDSAMASACNEIANAEELTVEIEEMEDGA